MRENSPATPLNEGAALPSGSSALPSASMPPAPAPGPAPYFPRLYLAPAGPAAAATSTKEVPSPERSSVVYRASHIRARLESLLDERLREELEELTSEEAMEAVLSAVASQLMQHTDHPAPLSYAHACPACRPTDTRPLSRCAAFM